MPGFGWTGAQLREDGCVEEMPWEGRTVTVGGLPRAQLLRSLRDSGVRLNAHAETLLEHPVFDDPEPRNLRFVTRSVGQLGLRSGGTLGDVLQAVHEHGLDACPAISGPFLRLATPAQENAPDSLLSSGRPPAGAVHVAAVPLSNEDTYPKGFYLRVVDDQPWLRGYRCDSSYRWDPDVVLALVQP